MVKHQLLAECASEQGITLTPFNMLLPDNYQEVCERRAAIERELRSIDIPLQANDDKQDELLEVILSEIKIADVADSPWEQIIEFRNDRESIKRYRKLRSWMSQISSTRNLEKFSEELRDAIEEYDEVLRKHGVRTIKGVLHQMVNIKNLIPFAASYHTLLEEEYFISIFTGLLGIANTTVNLADDYMEYVSCKRKLKSSEVSLLVEIRKAF